MNLLILAAGRGERFGKLTEDTPKPLIKWQGKPLIEHAYNSAKKILDMWDEQHKVYVSYGYLGKKLINEIPFHVDAFLNTTGQENAYALNFFKESKEKLLVIPCDIVFDCDIDIAADYQTYETSILIKAIHKRKESGDFINEDGGMIVGLSNYNFSNNKYLASGIQILDMEQINLYHKHKFNNFNNLWNSLIKHKALHCSENAIRDWRAFDTEDSLYVK